MTRPNLSRPELLDMRSVLERAVQRAERYRAAHPDYAKIDPKCWKMAPSPDREEKRSETEPGVARAIARQWGPIFHLATCRAALRSDELAGVGT